MAEETRKVIKLKLNDGHIYMVCDTGAIHIDDNGRLVTGNGVVDNVLINQNKFIIEIDDMPVDEYTDYYLVQKAGDTNVKRKRRKEVLKDIGGASFNIDSSTGTLSLKIGAQDEN